MSNSKCSICGMGAIYKYSPNSIYYHPQAVYQCHRCEYYWILHWINTSPIGELLKAVNEPMQFLVFEKVYRARLSGDTRPLRELFIKLNPYYEDTFVPMLKKIGIA